MHWSKQTLSPSTKNGVTSNEAAGESMFDIKVKKKMDDQRPDQIYKTCCVGTELSRANLRIMFEGKNVKTKAYSKA